MHRIRSPSDRIRFPVGSVEHSISDDEAKSGEGGRKEHGRAK